VCLNVCDNSGCVCVCGCLCISVHRLTCCASQYHIHTHKQTTMAITFKTVNKKVLLLCIAVVYAIFFETCLRLAWVHTDQSGWFRWLLVDPQSGIGTSFAIAVIWRLVYPKVLTRSQWIKYAGLMSLLVALCDIPIPFMNPYHEQDVSSDNLMGARIAVIVWGWMYFAIHVVVVRPYLKAKPPSSSERKRLGWVYVLLLAIFGIYSYGAWTGKLLIEIPFLFSMIFIFIFAIWHNQQNSSTPSPSATLLVGVLTHLFAAALGLGLLTAFESLKDNKMYIHTHNQ